MANEILILQHVVINLSSGSLEQNCFNIIYHDKLTD
jgi:hypothetical protein